MEPKVIDIILARMDKMEVKIDRLLEFKWRIVGAGVVMSLICTIVFQIALAFIERGN